MAPPPDSIELLDELDVLHRVEREAQTRTLLAATEFALTNMANAGVDPDRAGLPGRQRVVRLGGAGTPEVAEFTGALVGGRLQLSAWSADRLIADGLDLRYRLPGLYARLTACEVAVGHARLVARKTRHLSAEQAATVDARVAEVADGRLPWSRFEALLDAAVIAADPDAAAQRERGAAQDVCVRECRARGEGMGAIYVRGGLEATKQIAAAITDMAAALADTFPFASRTTRDVEIDHTIPYQRTGPPRQSAIGNYGPMTRRHHRIKTHGGWDVRQPFPGIYLWRDPTGPTTSSTTPARGGSRLHDPGGAG